jgi:hypothetical protein
MADSFRFHCYFVSLTIEQTFKCLLSLFCCNFHTAFICEPNYNSFERCFSFRLKYIIKCLLFYFELLSSLLKVLYVGRSTSLFISYILFRLCVICH